MDAVNQKVRLADFPEYQRDEAANIIDGLGDINPHEIAREYPVLFLAIRFAAPQLGDMAVAKVLLATRGVCPHCCGSSNPCHCMNDE